MAVRKGFEPLIRDERIHAFQACSFTHSDTSPKRVHIITDYPFGARFILDFCAIAGCLDLYDPVNKVMKRSGKSKISELIQSLKLSKQRGGLYYVVWINV